MYAKAEKENRVSAQHLSQCVGIKMTRIGVTSESVSRPRAMRESAEIALRCLILKCDDFCVSSNVSGLEILDFGILGVEPFHWNAG